MAIIRLRKYKIEFRAKIAFWSGDFLRMRLLPTGPLVYIERNFILSSVLAIGFTRAGPKAPPVEITVPNRTNKGAG